MQDDARRGLIERVRTMPADGDLPTRLGRLRALLQEFGIDCDESVDLHDLDAALFASSHGTEAVVSSRLDEAQRLVAYARLIARLMMGELHGPLDANFEYADDRMAPSRREREEERMIIALAHAIADGRLDTAPRPLYQEVPKLTLAFTPRSAARSTLGGFHLWSDYWYKRSNMYRRWRSRRDVSNAIRRVCGALGAA
jgi:hypothetical protein